MSLIAAPLTMRAAAVVASTSSSDPLAKLGEPAPSWRSLPGRRGIQDRPVGCYCYYYYQNAERYCGASTFAAKCHNIRYRLLIRLDNGLYYS